MIRAGYREDVMKSDTIWLCASCYLCAARCPKDIKITDKKGLYIRNQYMNRIFGQMMRLELDLRLIFGKQSI